MVKKNYYFLFRFAEKIVHETLAEAESEQRTILAEKFELECKRLSELHHPNIVCFIGVYFKRNKPLPSLIMELLPMSLDHAVTNFPNIPSYMKYTVLLDVACGLCYLHTREDPVVHRDLTSKNVVLTSNFQAKIADFGVARVIPLEKLNQKLTVAPGNVVFMPPETLLNDPVYNVSLDMFSYGVLILNIVNQSWPKTKSQVEGNTILTEVQRRVDDLETPAMASHPLKEFTLRCLAEPKARPDSLEATEKLVELVKANPWPFSDSLMMLKEIDGLRSSLQELETQVVDFRNELKYKGSENDQLREQVAAKDDQMRLAISDLQSTIVIKERKMSLLEEERKSHGDIVQGKDDRIAALERELAALKNMPHHKVKFLIVCT